MNRIRPKPQHTAASEGQAGKDKTFVAVAIVLLLIGGAIVGASVAEGSVAGVLVGVAVGAGGRVLQRRSGSCSCC